MKRILLPALLALLALAPAAPAQEQVLARIDVPTPIAAHDGRLAYSVRDGAGGFALVSRAGGLTARVPVRSRPVPFDVDLGPDASGATIAVYSRCATDAPFVTTGSVAYDDGRGCDIYAFDFRLGRERRLLAASSPTASEFWPSVWRGRIAFGRTYDHKRDYPYLYVKDLDSRRPSERQPGGQREECFRDPRTRRVSCSDDRRSAPSALELYGSRLGFAWSYQGNAEGRSYELRLDTLGGGHRRVAAQGGGGLTAVTLGWPAFEAGRLYWTQSCFGDGSGCPGRYRLARLAYGARNAVPTSARPPETNVLSHDRDGGTTYVLVDRSGVDDCQGDPPVAGGTCELLALRPAFG